MVLSGERYTNPTKVSQHSLHVAYGEGYSRLMSQHGLNTCPDYAFIILAWPKL